MVKCVMRKTKKRAVANFQFATALLCYAKTYILELSNSCARKSFCFLLDAAVLTARRRVRQHKEVRRQRGIKGEEGFL